MNTQFYGATTMNGWSVVYKRAIEPDGSLLFPQKLTKEFLDGALKTMGSYFYANQYLNEVIPADKMTFKREWIQYHEAVPKKVNTFVIIDPAISQDDNADYTGVIVFDVDSTAHRYVRYAKRYRMTPTELVSFIFDVNEAFHPMMIGVESVAYQKAILYFLHNEMQRRKTVLPVCEIKVDTNKSKEMRILSLVPWLQWGRMTFERGLNDLEHELMTFPRGSHDDLIDPLAHGDQIAVTPNEEVNDVRPNPANASAYEQWYRNQLATKGKPERFDPES